MIAFRHTDPRYPFLWEQASQPAGRWNAEGELTHYFSDTPDGAWAEFLRQEEIVDPEDLATIRRALWAVDLGDEPAAPLELPRETLTGGRESWPACQQRAGVLRDRGKGGLTAPSAALRPGGAHGWRVDGGPAAGPPQGRQGVRTLRTAPVSGRLGRDGRRPSRRRASGPSAAFLTAGHSLSRSPISAPEGWRRVVGESAIRQPRRINGQ